jgi:ascorbate-specific PTS system EIIC-type component UlaA
VGVGFFCNKQGGRKAALFVAAALALSVTNLLKAELK